MNMHATALAAAAPAPSPLALPVALTDHAPLAAAVAAILRTVERRSSIPVLSHLMLSAAGDDLVIEATDLDIVTTVRVPAAINPGFRAVVPARELADVLRATKGASLASLSVGGSALTVEVDTTRSTLATMDPADWPTLAGIDESLPSALSATVPVGPLLHALSTCWHAISTETTRYYLTGVFLEVIPDAPGAKTGKLRTVATDGHRLAAVDTGIPFPCAGFGIIVPRKTVDLWIRAMKAKGAPATARLVATTTRCALVLGTVSITSKVINGTFPDYRRVIPHPTSVKRTLAVGRSALAAAANAAAAVLPNRGQAVRLTATPRTLTVTGTSDDNGIASREIPATCELAPGEADFTIGFNARYICDLCDALAGDAVTLRIQDAGAPIRVDDGATVYVLMPMRN